MEKGDTASQLHGVCTHVELCGPDVLVKSNAVSPKACCRWAMRLDSERVVLDCPDPVIQFLLNRGSWEPGTLSSVRVKRAGSFFSKIMLATMWRMNRNRESP